jgi:hypothetical protein
MQALFEVKIVSKRVELHAAHQFFDDISGAIVHVN